MGTLCAGLFWTPIRARPGLLDKNIGTSDRFYAYITEKSHTKNAKYFLDRGWGAYALYATCMATPLLKSTCVWFQNSVGTLTLFPVLYQFPVEKRRQYLVVVARNYNLLTGNEKKKQGVASAWSSYYYISAELAYRIYK